LPLLLVFIHCYVSFIEAIIINNKTHYIVSLAAIILRHAIYFHAMPHYWLFAAIAATIASLLLLHILAPRIFMPLHTLVYIITTIIGMILLVITYFINIRHYMLQILFINIIIIVIFTIIINNIFILSLIIFHILLDYIINININIILLLLVSLPSLAGSLVFHYCHTFAIILATYIYIHTYHTHYYY